jgi:hypothetical protein
MGTALPSPISIIAMTAAMPMTIPRHVIVERSKFLRSARVETAMTSAKHRTAVPGDSCAATRDGFRAVCFGVASGSGFGSATACGGGAVVLICHIDFTRSVRAREVTANC